MHYGRGAVKSVFGSAALRYALLISYDGTEFAGWQIQPNKRTVQGELARACEEIFGEQITITGSGRTDAGVHAKGQVCHFDADTGIPAEKLSACFNRVLPPDVRVLKSLLAPDGFDCTRGAKRKTYCYRFYYAPTQLPLVERYAVLLPNLPNLQKMQECAKLLVGEHDFSAFRATGGSAKTTVREIYSAEVAKRGELFELTVCGNGFLYNMVRIIAGEVIAVGCGKEEGVTRAFQTGERSLLAKTMPAKGLVMERVEYDFALFGATEE